MHEALREILERADDPVGCEFPPERTRAEWDALILDIETIQQKIEAEFGVALERDGQVQDASFIDDLFILTKGQAEARKAGSWAHCYELAIRFSNFGRLFTVWSCLDEMPRRYPREGIIRVVSQHGWHYVPPEVLDETYDGRNPHLRGEAITWWIRFFDYL